jgi:hypothetical protein
MKLKETRCFPDDAPEMVAEKLSRTYSSWLLTKEGGGLEYKNKEFVKNMNNEDAAEKLLLLKIMENHRKSKDQQLRASSIIEVVGKCYMEVTKDIMFSVFWQSVAKHLGVDVLDKSKKNLVRGQIKDLNKASKLVLPAVNKKRGAIMREDLIKDDKAAGGEKEDECSDGNALMVDGYNEDATGAEINFGTTPVVNYLWSGPQCVGQPAKQPCLV